MIVRFSSQLTVLLENIVIRWEQRIDFWQGFRGEGFYGVKLKLTKSWPKDYDNPLGLSHNKNLIRKRDSIQKYKSYKKVKYTDDHTECHGLVGSKLAEVAA